MDGCCSSVGSAMAGRRVQTGVGRSVAVMEADEIGARPGQRWVGVRTCDRAVVRRPLFAVCISTSRLARLERVYLRVAPRAPPHFLGALFRSNRAAIATGSSKGVP
jgi:hypothetical protein